MTALQTALKMGVDIRGISAECLFGVLVAAEVYEDFNVPFIVTSVRDGKHGAHSLHYVGHAFDCRLPSRYSPKPGLDESVVEALRLALGGNAQDNGAGQFDVVLEDDHIHCEFDPAPKTMAAGVAG
jgi:hypothetical protein